jgi:hypothetical protein
LNEDEVVKKSEEGGEREEKIANRGGVTNFDEKLSEYIIPSDPRP